MHRIPRCFYNYNPDKRPCTIMFLTFSMSRQKRRSLLFVHYPGVPPISDAKRNGLGCLTSLSRALVNRI
jgi:hypothetical protein